MTPAEMLLAHRVDYAGMFPPASLNLATCLVEYDRYRSGAAAWALGRFVLPAGSLAGFRAHTAASEKPCPISVLLGSAWENDIRLAAQMGVPLEVVEFKPRNLEEIATLRKSLPETSVVYFEVAVDACMPQYLSAVANAGACAKIRTGGITADAIPSSAQVVRFLSACLQLRIPFKATAGLHHAVHAFHSLTYEVGSERAVMHGFVNVILADAMLLAGGDPENALELLDDSSAASFTFSDDAVQWRDFRFSLGTLQQARSKSLQSFGSCSFHEPISELRQLGWL